MTLAAFLPHTAHRFRQLAACLCAGLVAGHVIASMLDVREGDEVFDPIVVLLSIDVMHVFIGPQQSTKMAFHHEPVFQHIAGQNPAAGVRMIGRVGVDVTALTDSSACEIPVLFGQRLNAMAAHEWRGVAAEVTPSLVGDCRDGRLLPASALAEARRSFVGARYVASLRRFAAMRMAGEESSRIVVDGRRGLPFQRASTAALADGRAVLVGHGSNLTIGA